MISVQLLESSDTIDPDDWCRPLVLITMSGGYSDVMSFSNPYSGSPANNAKWVRAKHVIGKPWMGKTVGQFNRVMGDCGSPYEFVRGDIPRSHRLNMRDYPK